MKKKHQHPPIHVYPPFPSFAWVMTAQANPPAPAYAYGYIQSAHVHNGIHPNPHPRLPAHRVSPRARHCWPHLRSTKSRSPPTTRAAKSKGPAAAAVAAAAVAHNEKFMVNSISLFGQFVGGRKLSYVSPSPPAGFLLGNGGLSISRSAIEAVRALA